VSEKTIPVGYLRFTVNNEKSNGDCRIGLQFNDHVILDPTSNDWVGAPGGKSRSVDVNVGVFASEFREYKVDCEGCRTGDKYDWHQGSEYDLTDDLEKDRFYFSRGDEGSRCVIEDIVFLDPVQTLSNCDDCGDKQKCDECDNFGAFW